MNDKTTPLSAVAVDPLVMPRVERAAILDHDGVVYSVPQPGRHHDVIRLMADSGCRTPITGEQGFVLSDGRFARRKAAADIALRAGQVDKIAHPHHGLFSEDVW